MATKIKFFFSFFILVFFYGCATVPPPSEIPFQTYNISGVNYVPLQNLCDSSGMSWSWDSVTQTAVLKRSEHEIKLLVDSPMVSVDGLFEKITPPPRNYQGVIVVPWKFKEQIISKIAKPERISEEVYAAGYRIRKIVIDPGHGGKDPGAIGKGGMREKDLVLDIARRVRDELKANGFEVVMTRDRDEFISLPERAAISNRAKADLFVSIHANANRSRWIRGFEVYHPRERGEAAIADLIGEKDSANLFRDLKMSRSSRNTKAIVMDLIYTQNQADAINLSSCIVGSANRNLEVRDRAVKAASFYVLKNARIPAILIEIGYITNANEAKSLKSDSYRQEVTDSIVKGITNYKQQCLLGRARK